MKIGVAFVLAGTLVVTLSGSQSRSSSQEDLRGSRGRGSQSLRNSGKTVFPVTFDLDLFNVRMRQCIDHAVKHKMYPDFALIQYPNDCAGVSKAYDLIYTHGIIPMIENKYIVEVHALDFLLSLQKVYDCNLSYYGSKVELNFREKENFFPELRGQLEAAEKMHTTSNVAQMSDINRDDYPSATKVDLHKIDKFFEKCIKTGKRKGINPDISLMHEGDKTAILEIVGMLRDEKKLFVVREVGEQEHACKMPKTAKEFTETFIVILYRQLVNNNLKTDSAFPLLHEKLTEAIKFYKLEKAIDSRVCKNDE